MGKRICDNCDAYSYWHYRRQKFHPEVFLFPFYFCNLGYFYYVFLKLTLNWPQSLLTWDILFLIPVPWVGPVLAPVICSLTMILISCTIVFTEEQGYIVTMKVWDWVLMLLGAFIIFAHSSMIILSLFSMKGLPLALVT